MTNSQALILGVVQGLTEYLPISSSAHLVLLPNFLGWQLKHDEAFIFDILVQLGTLVGVFAYFFQPIKQVAFSVLSGVWHLKPLHNEEARLGWMVALASIPAALLGFCFKDPIAAYFSSAFAACSCLMATGFFLLAAEYFGRSQKKNPTRRDAMVIGLAQGFALLPGISRSGSTIAAGMACGLSRVDAARFSFLMSIPIMVGASLIAGNEALSDPALLNRLMMPLAIGFFSAAITGFFVIRWFVHFLERRSLVLFASYCLGLGFLGALYFG